MTFPDVNFVMSYAKKLRSEFAQIGREMRRKLLRNKGQEIYFVIKTGDGNRLMDRIEELGNFPKTVRSACYPVKVEEIDTSVLLYNDNLDELAWKLVKHMNKAHVIHYSFKPIIESTDELYRIVKFELS